MSSILQKVAPIGEARERELLKDASSYIYHRAPQGDLLAHVFLPEQPVSGPRPVIVFFHGGFWEAPMPTQFVPHCLHFASRGAVAVSAEVRVSSKHGTTAVEAIEDARALIRWLRKNSDTLDLDPDRITAAGAAGGALLALLTAMPREKDLPPVDGVSCRPQALVLFSALVNAGPKTRAVDRFPSPKLAKQFSPSSLVRSKLPPMLLFHGKNDRITPFDDVEKFRRRLRWRRNSCELIAFDGADHSFFNFNVSHLHFELAVDAADEFLLKHGLLDPHPQESAEAATF